MRDKEKKTERKGQIGDRIVVTYRVLAPSVPSQSPSSLTIFATKSIGTNTWSPSRRWRRCIDPESSQTIRHLCSIRIRDSFQCECNQGHPWLDERVAGNTRRANGRTFATVVDAGYMVHCASLYRTQFGLNKRALAMVDRTLANQDLRYPLSSCLDTYLRSSIIISDHLAEYTLHINK